MINPFNYIKISSKFELVYVDKNNEKFLFNTQVLDIFPDRIKLSTPVNKLENFTIVDAYEKLEMNFYTEEGIYTSNVNFLDFEDNTYTNVYISYPYNNNFTQRRASKRIPMHVDCELNILNSGNGVMNTVYFKTKDISESGTACITKEPLPAFENARLVLHFESIDVIVFCKKVYSKEIELNDERIYLNGLEFNEISKEDIKIINQESLKFQYNVSNSEGMSMVL